MRLGEGSGVGRDDEIRDVGLETVRVGRLAGGWCGMAGMVIVVVDVEKQGWWVGCMIVIWLRWGKGRGGRCALG